MMDTDLNALDKEAGRFFAIVLIAGVCAIFTYLVVGE